MPRVKALTEADRLNRKVQGAIEAGMTENGIRNLDELGERMGMSHGTIYNRMKRPETWTVGEIRKLKRIMPGIEIV